MPITTLGEFLARSNSKDNPFDYIIVGGGTAGLVLAHRYVHRSHSEAEAKHQISP
jgi:hypothetical protein